MRKLFLYMFLGLLWCNFTYAEHRCIITLDGADGNPINIDKRIPENIFFRTCIEGLVYNSDHCECTKYTSSKDLTIVGENKLDFSDLTKVDFNSELIDMRKKGDYSIQDEDDKYFLNILAHNLLDLKIISQKEFKKILKYKRKKSKNIKGVKLLCGENPNSIVSDELKGISFIGIEFKGLSDFIGYGFEDDIWHDIKGNYKRTVKDIELSYTIIGTDKEDSFDIDRKTLKPWSDTQCTIMNPSIDMRKILSFISLKIATSNENKL